MIVDVNTLPILFSKSNARHEIYEDILEWFLYDKAKIVLGGKLFTTEICEKMAGYISLVSELNKCGKIHFINNEDVDKHEKLIKASEKDSDFDDPHIVALFDLSGAKIFCSEDSRSFKFIKKKELYKFRKDIPKIYTGKLSHQPADNLLSHLNICSMGEHKVLPKKTADKILEMINSR